MSGFDSSTSDGMLIAAVRAGEGEAFAHLVRRYQPALLKAAVSRVGQRQVAEEAVQEAFLCAHRWLATYDSRYSFRTWLWTILLNQCSRLGKRESRQGSPHAPREEPVTRSVTTTIGDRACTERSPLEEVLARESEQRLHDLLNQLPETQADALRLRFFGELTFPEIAAAMRCSESGAKNRVKLGLVQLSKWLMELAGPRACPTRTRSCEKS